MASAINIENKELVILALCSSFSTGKFDKRNQKNTKIQKICSINNYFKKKNKYEQVKDLFTKQKIKSQFYEIKESIQ